MPAHDPWAARWVALLAAHPELDELAARPPTAQDRPVIIDVTPRQHLGRLALVVAIAGVLAVLAGMIVTATAPAEAGQCVAGALTTGGALSIAWASTRIIPERPAARR